MVEPRGAARCRLAALRLPGVEADVMVIPARRDERCLIAEPRHELEAEHADIERERPVEVCDLQVDVPDVDIGVDWPVPDLRRLLSCAHVVERSSCGRANAG